jgi:hypothetical protein
MLSIGVVSKRERSFISLNIAATATKKYLFVKVQAFALKKENESQCPHSYCLHTTRRIFKSIFFFEGWSSRGNNNILSSPCLRFAKIIM